jgi:hypothetical protein
MEASRNGLKAGKHRQKEKSKNPEGSHNMFQGRKSRRFLKSNLHDKESPNWFGQFLVS